MMHMIPLVELTSRKHWWSLALIVTGIPNHVHLKWLDLWLQSIPHALVTIPEWLNNELNRISFRVWRDQCKVTLSSIILVPIASSVFPSLIRCSSTVSSSQWSLAGKDYYLSRWSHRRSTNGCYRRRVASIEWTLHDSARRLRVRLSLSCSLWSVHLLHWFPVSVLS